MPQGALKLASNGSANQLPNGAAIAYADDEETDCCCGDLQPVECLTDTRTVRTLRSRGGPAPTTYGPSYQPSDDYLFVPDDKGGTGPLDPMEGGREANSPNCMRLYVWERRTVTGNVYGGAAAPDWILKTSGRGQRTDIGGPFETAVASGIDLDVEPYWWVTCLRGGYETVASMWFAITSATIDAARSSVLADGTYTMLALVRFSHWTEKSVDGGGVLIVETDGGVSLMEVKHIRYA